MAKLTGISDNLNAFLDMIAFSEIGQALLAKSDDGYNVLAGGKLFTSYADHPHVKVDIPRLNIYSTAAGRYQLIWNTWQSCKCSLDLSDYSPICQDLSAVLLVRKRGALSHIESGDISKAITLCSKEWGSFPGSPYGQGENKMSALLYAYKRAGGKVA